MKKFFVEKLGMAEWDYSYLMANLWIIIILFIITPLMIIFLPRSVQPVQKEYYCKDSSMTLYTTKSGIKVCGIPAQEKI